MMPKYFTAAAQYTNIPTLRDLERPPVRKHERTPSASTRGRTTRTNTAGTNTPRTDTPQLPRPTLSRSQSGRISVTNSRPHTPHSRIAPVRIDHSNHSRSGSNISIDIAAAEARSNTPRFQGRLNPLRMSPVVPFSPPNSLGPAMHPFGAGPFTQKPSDASGIVALESLSPQGATKPLPLTPFPVGGGG